MGEDNGKGIVMGFMIIIMAIIISASIAIPL